MKNLFKIGFLGLALTIGLASCNNTTTQEGETTDSLANEVQDATDSIADSLNNAADSIQSTGDSIADSLENVQ